MTRPVDVHIEELVLPECLGLDAGALRDALEHDLAGLVAQRGLPSAWTDGARVGTLSSPDPVPVATPQAIGRSLAEAIHEGRTR